MGLVLLRVSHAVVGDRHRVEAELESEHGRQTVSSEFTFSEQPGDRDGIRWYLEDFLEFPGDPAPVIAGRVESRLAGIGKELFDGVFGSRDGQRLWDRAQERLEQVRVEVEADPAAGVGLPWELLRDPVTEVPVALRARSFVRSHPQPAQPLRLPDPLDATVASRERMRILLVICRPGGGDDVPFRSVASHLVRSDAQQQISGLDLDVLRPPTFAQLSKVLRAAARAGRPYQVVHFDGHGTFLDLTTDEDDTADPTDSASADGADESRGGGGSGGGMSPYRYATVSPARPGRHGYLLFERPDAVSNQELVDGPTLGALLAETNVPVLVLNACRSAYNEPATPSTNDPADTANGTSDEAAGAEAGAVGVHARVRAYGSLAAEVADAGVPGVVAMRYNVYVVTATQFVAELYAGLLQGRGLGDAVSDARRHLAADPQRQIGQLPPVRLQDWSVPVVFETAPLTLFTPSGPARDTNGHEAPVVMLTPPEQPAEQTGADKANAMPHRPDAGFHGRDATLLTLDRAFDTHRVVLLHALAGAGKTTTVAEFARWYTDTGGLDTSTGATGPVLFTTFEHHRALPQLLAQIGDTFEAVLSANEIAWQTLTVAEQRAYAVQIAEQLPMLWIWDNVEPVTGFPAGAPTPWAVTEQAELVAFLRDLDGTRARVVLTSRRDESAWLGDLPVRVELPSMPMRERFALAQALAARQPDSTGRPRILNLDAWRPLLRYSGGNPLTLTVVVGQALRRNLTSPDQLAEFVAQLSQGRTAPESFEDRALGRSASLAASLDYGFSQAFTEAERAQLAVLHLFRSTVDVDALLMMGDPDIPGQVPALAGLTRDQAIVLLDRAAQIGLLTGLGGGYYSIHPALPWYFTNLFTHSYGAPDSVEAARVTHAYASAYGKIGNFYHGLLVDGRDDVANTVAIEEENLLHAFQLGRAQQDWFAALGAAQCLRLQYKQQGRAAEWARLVGDLTSDVIDAATNKPRPGTEDYYSLVTEYRLSVAHYARDWDTATRLQQQLIAWNRTQAATALATPATDLDDDDRASIRSLAVSLENVAAGLLEQEDPGCVPQYREAVELYGRIAASREEAVAQLALGVAYLKIPNIRNLDLADQAFQASVRLAPQHLNTSLRAQAVSQIAALSLHRFIDARAAGADSEKLVEHLNGALTGYHECLELLRDDTPGLAIIYNQLGSVYMYANNINQALANFQQSIRYKEQAGNTYGAGLTRYNVATMLREIRPDDALDWAYAALRNFHTVGAGASENIKTTERLIQTIGQAPDQSLSSP